MRYLSSIIFLLLVLVQGAEAKTAYIGVAGSGDGMGMLGHVFLVIADRPKAMLGAQAYQFNIDASAMAAELGGDPLKAGYDAATKMDFKQAPFILDRTNALEFIRIYTAENRTVTLFQTRLRPEEVERLERLLDQELIRRKNKTVKDYDIVDNNCATQAVSFVNQSLLSKRESRAIPLNWRAKSKKLFSTDAWVSNVPLTLAPVLEKSPQVDPAGTVEFNSDRKDRILVSSLLIDRLQKLSKACTWDDTTYQFYSALMVNPHTRVSIRLLKAFTDQVKVCRKKGIAKVGGMANEVLDVIIFDFQQHVPLPFDQMIKRSQELESLYF